MLASAAGKPLAEPVQLRAHGKGFPSEHFPASWTASRLGAAFTLMDMFSAAPFEVVEPDHWVFSGASLQEGDIFGEESLFVPEAWIDFWARYNYPTGGQGASGLYMSKVTAGSEDFQILAQGLNAEGGAHMVYRDTPAGGWIFSSSSETFNGALSKDPVIALIVRNLLDRKPGSGGTGTTDKRELPKPATEHKQGALGG